MARIVISYSHADRQFMNDVVPLLKKVFSTHIVWFDEHISAGENWWQNIVSEIGKCDLFLFFVSNDALKSEYCQKEFREARSKEKRILPVIVRPSTSITDEAPSDIKNFMTTTQYVNLEDGVGDINACAHLYGEINKRLAQITLSGSTKLEISENDTDKLQRESTRLNKHRVANVYWLASDLSFAVMIARGGTPDQVKHYVKQTFWHTVQLSIGESIEHRFSKLCEKTHSFIDADWNSPEKRDEIATEFSDLLIEVAAVLQAEQPDFGKGEPPVGWKTC